MDNTLFRSGVGTDVTDCITYQEVIEKAGLNFEVKKCPVVAQLADNQTKQCNMAYAIYRTDTNIPLGVVKEKYTPVQNINAFNDLDELVKTGKLSWTSAGAFGYGQKIFVCAKITTNIIIGETDLINNYLVLSNSHDGTSSLDILFTPMRVACTNMINGALQESLSHIKFRHTQNIQANFDNAISVFKQSIKNMNEAQTIYDILYACRIDDKTALSYIEKVFLSEEELKSAKLMDENNWMYRIISRDEDFLKANNISTRKTNIIDATWVYYNSDETQKNIIGTKWGAYNAITGYYSNVANLNGEKKLNSLLYGNARNIGSKALNILGEAI